jgi:AcrR family transcriptional regulator
LKPTVALANNFAPGKQRLIEAALRLSAEKRSFAALGIRELARAAGLNPNTFYRHFDTLEDLGLAAVGLIDAQLRPMLRHERWLAARDQSASVAHRASVAFFAFALEHAEAFVVGIAMYHGASPRLREGVRATLRGVALEMADDVVRLQLVAPLARATLDEICWHIVQQFFHMALDYIEQPGQRSAILASAERFVLWIFAGAAVASPDAA